MEKNKELSENDKMKQMRSEGFSYSLIAEEFGMSASQVGNICRHVKILRDYRITKPSKD